MKTRRNIRTQFLLFCSMFAALCICLLVISGVYGARLVESPYNMHIRKRKNMVTAGELLDRKGRVLAYTDQSGRRRYAEQQTLRQALCHIVGDTYGQTVGAEANFSEYTYGFDQPFGESLRQYIQGDFMSGSDVSLTVDAELSRYIYKLMDENPGGVVVMNYKTGEILSSVSLPGFDPEKIQDYLSGDKVLEDGALVNRSTMAYYTPGSTFKLLTLTAALRYLNGAEELRFSCEGPLAFDERSGRYLPDVKLPAANEEADARKESIGGPPDYAGYGRVSSSRQRRCTTLGDSHGRYHGTVSLEEAFAEDCNTSFAQLAMMLGAQRLEETAQELCIGEEFRFDDIMLYKSVYDAGNTDLELSWSALGQYTDLMTPMQACMLSCAIANDGVMMEPKLLLQVRTPGGAQSKALQSEAYKTVLSKKEAETLQGYMRSAVENGTGKGAGISGYDVCGKTGSAEISSDKSVNSHAWFTGFVLDEEHPLAVCVVLEQAGSGEDIAAPLAGKALKKALELGY